MASLGVWICLQDDYQEMVKHLTIFHRETYQYQQTLQLMRLEHNLGMISQYIQRFQLDSEDAEIKPSTIRSLGILSKEVRCTVEAISKLTGVNAPVEVVVSQKLQHEVDTLIAILGQELDRDTFQRVSQAISTGMAKVKGKAELSELN